MSKNFSRFYGFFGISKLYGCQSWDNLPWQSFKWCTFQPCFQYQSTWPSPNESTTPITAMGCQQYLPLSVVQLKDKHCQKSHCCNGVVDTFGPCGLGLQSSHHEVPGSNQLQDDSRVTPKWWRPSKVGIFISNRIMFFGHSAPIHSKGLLSNEPPLESSWSQFEPGTSWWIDWRPG